MHFSAMGVTDGSVSLMSLRNSDAIFNPGQSVALKSLSMWVGCWLPRPVDTACTLLQPLMNRLPSYQLLDVRVLYISEYFLLKLEQVTSNLQHEMKMAAEFDRLVC